MLRIVTDGAADMPAGWEKEYDIQVIPINIQFGDKTYLQGVDLSNEAFYRLVDESGKIPKTSQPSPFQFKEFYQRVAKPGDTILSLHVTSKLSGTFESAVDCGARTGREVQHHPVRFRRRVGCAWHDVPRGTFDGTRRGRRPADR